MSNDRTRRHMETRIDTGREGDNVKHTIFDGRVHLYKRGRSRYWQCMTFLDGKKKRSINSTN